MTDFKAIVSELRTTGGMSQLEIAQEVGAGISTIADLEGQEGRQPRYTLGAKIVALHAERVLKRRHRKAAAA